MVWVAVDKDGTELMFGGRPDRRKDSWFCYSSVDLLNLPNGSIKKLIGRKLTWKDEPVELIEKPKEDKKLREIKFRAKVIYHPSILDNDKATGEWVYGDLHLKSKIPHINIDLQHKYPIDINTIGQFTGCYDKNGREIYEGDIVISDNILNKVIFQDGAFMIDEISTFVAMDALSEFDMADFEIVGNIYDNPELKNSESIYKD